MEEKLTIFLKSLNLVPDSSYEVHIVTFPSLENFENYKRDEEILNLTGQRNSIIKRTDIWILMEIETYL